MTATHSPTPVKGQPVCAGETQQAQRDVGPREEGATASKKRASLRAVLIATLIVLGTMLASATPAQAYPYGNAYLVVNNWRCVGGGTVKAVSGAVDQVWTGGDAGDNIIYAKVDLYRKNTFNGRAYCDRPWYDPRGDYWINIVWWQFTPTRSGQTFWY